MRVRVYGSEWLDREAEHRHSIRPGAEGEDALRYGNEGQARPVGARDLSHGAPGAAGEVAEDGEDREATREAEGGVGEGDEEADAVGVLLG